MARKNLLKGFKKPKGISFEHISTNPNYGKFTAYPFETGFGTTVGNTLRRVLLSSIQGYAITSIRITSYDENGIRRTGGSALEVVTMMNGTKIIPTRIFAQTGTIRATYKTNQEDDDYKYITDGFEKNW